MNKRPSIHIYLEDLREALADCDYPYIVLEDAIIKRAQSNPVHRTLIVTNKATKKKLKRSATDNVEKFNEMLNSERMRLQHRNVRNIFHGDRMYLTLCDVSKDAEEFCEVFGLTIHAGFQLYCRMGLKKIGKRYGLNKFKTYKDYIFDNHTHYLAVKEDPAKELTLEYAEYYVKKCGIKKLSQAKNILDTYHHDFVYCKDQAEKVDSNPKSWIDSQFLGLKYLNVTPEPYQLHGEEANKRHLANHKQTGDDSWRKKAMEL